MPSSTYHIINQTVEQILKFNPTSVLDIGIGFGKYGFLCREYLECWKDRVFPNQWQVKIDGIEIYKPYTELIHNEKIYDKIYIGDVTEKIKEVGHYDLIIAMDVIEHLEKIVGIDLGREIIRKANKGVIINVPTGNWLNNVVVANNPNEAHQAIWEERDLEFLAQEVGVKLEKYSWAQNNRTGCMGVFKK
jgi:hypothetical protein